MAVRLKLLLRVCAVGSSLLLVAALVAYRAGAMGWLIQAESMAVAASTPPATEPADGRPTPREPRPRPRATASPESKVIFGGSKSFVLEGASDVDSSRTIIVPKEEDATPTPRPNE